MDERSPETPTAGPARAARDRTAEREAYREFIQHYGDCPACQAGTACETERELWAAYRRIRDENRAAAR
ncbi:hypothetical protein [Streptomyces griseofuscus]|uniref:hypothetical protein n=1 Tax=Streptomyces griseofuscus TaxID=146922 RepID=UPI000F64D0F8|nr:hypothetical protein [Streptomyces griseofuscus]